MATKAEIIARLAVLKDHAESPEELKALIAELREQSSDISQETDTARRQRLQAYLAQADDQLELTQLQKAISILRAHGVLSQAKNRLLALESSNTAAPDVVSFASDVLERLALTDAEANARLATELAKSPSEVDHTKVRRLMDRERQAWRRQSNGEN